MARTVERRLPVKLTEQEIAECAQEMAKQAIAAVVTELEIDSKKERAKGEIKALKEHLLSVRGRLGELARQVEKGEDMRLVPCEARVAPDNSKVEIFRLDTGEVVATRSLTEEDRQMELDDVLARIEEDTAKTETHEEPSPAAEIKPDAEAEAEAETDEVDDDDHLDEIGA